MRKLFAKAVISLVHKLCERALTPHSYECWLRIRRELCRAYKIHNLAREK